MIPLRLGRTVATFALAFALFGCSRPVSSVTGSVSYNGKPLMGGSVTFVSQDGNSSRSTDISETGTFSLDKLVAGDYKVCVDTSFLAPQNTSGLPAMGSGGKMMMPPPTQPTIPKGAKTAPPKDASVPEGYAPSDPATMASAQNAKKYVKIPEKYKDPDKTDLRFQAKGGPETFPIELK